MCKSRASLRGQRTLKCAPNMPIPFPAQTLRLQLPPSGKNLPPECDPPHIPTLLRALLRAADATWAAWHASCSLSRRPTDRRNSDMPLDLNTYLGIEPDALKVYSQRAEVLAANVANADTPGYRARDIDFRAALAAADTQGEGLQPAATTPGDGTEAATGGGNLSTEQFLKYRVPLAPSLDGNTVDTQMEESQFAQNSVRFRAALTFLQNRFSQLTTAIVGQ